MPPAVGQLLAESSIFRRLSAEDRERLARVASIRTFEEGQTIFSEGDPSTHFFTVVSGRTKVFKTTQAGKEVILELFGPGDPLGASAAYEGRPFPATAQATEPTTCIALPRDAFLALLEQHPTLARGLLSGLTVRLIQLASRVAELSGGHVDARLGRLLIKLADEVGRPVPEGILVPLRLRRQELADFVGSTEETTIRTMSRWAKSGIVLTRSDGFLIADRGALELIADGAS